MTDIRPQKHSPEYIAADQKLDSICIKLIENIEEVVKKLPADEQRHLIMSWFGDEIFDAYTEWMLGE